MNTPIIYNRDGSLGADGWMHIVPRGELLNKTAEVAQVLGDSELDSILNDLQNKQGMGDRWAGLYFGAEHHIYDEDQSSEAYGWGKLFQKRADGIWCKPELTDLGETAIRNKRFKFTSFVCDPNKPGAMEKLGGNRVRILKIDTVGFTNLPAGRELLSPIANRHATKEDLLADTRRWAAGELDAVTSRLEKTFRIARPDAQRIAVFFNRSMARLAGTAGEDIGSDHAPIGRVCSEFKLLVNRYQAAHRLTFQEAWNQVACLEKEIYLAMCQRQ